jgi:hypothetical protein
VDRKQMETIGTPSKSDEPIRTEDANAAEEIVEVSSETDSVAAASADDDTKTDEADPSKPVDPELAGALQMYQTRDSSPAENSDPPPPSDNMALPPGQLVETTAKAEDIPSGFIVVSSAGGKDSNSDGERATDKMEVGDALDSEQDSNAPVSGTPVAGPEALAEELDKVVAKFEEEMDKAAQS